VEALKRFSDAHVKRSAVFRPGKISP